MRLLLERFKKFCWKIFEPFFPTVRDAWVALGLINHNLRQPYLYGALKAEFTHNDLRTYLKAAGFTNDYLAWVDPDEILNMRKVVDVIYQYHVRLFVDGEVRGHHEFAAESHPFKHLHDIGLTDGSPYLTPLLAGMVDELPAPEESLRSTTQGETS
ncbi:MAG: hypothetical protein U1C53_01350 [Candidatus Veblenbacteria bacterium]|nr:hypothetical protein [Candidatus Veblenbacteria bacterium]MDZ4229760.1 hypothetical protein [Candidatus Veblenbacteria bacterium]